MKVEVKKGLVDNLKADTLVVFAHKSSGHKSGSPKGNKKTGAAKDAPAKVVVAFEDKQVQDLVNASFHNKALTGNANEAVFFRGASIANGRHLLIVGLGEAKDVQAETLRQAAAAALTTLKNSKCQSAAVAIDSLPKVDIPTSDTVQAITEGLLLADYTFNDFKEQKSESLDKVYLVTSSKEKDLEARAQAGEILAEAVKFSRWLGDSPGNRMTPAILAEQTVKAAKGTKLKVTVWDKARIKSEKMGSFLSVSLGSAQDPRFIIMEYKGADAKKAPVCFVGKGLTFDCGGISIKPSAGMEEMKFDMCGGATVIATMLAIAQLKLKVNAIAYVPATENMPGPAANKPGDIVTARNGKTIEVNNTDAEGRLILADALVYACEQEPCMIVDTATLTGAMVVALGNLHTGVFTRNEKLMQKIREAAQVSGEWIWQMPLTDYHVRDMKGTYADLSNISSSKGAGSATAAAFLEQFVDKDIPWAHFDIAGTGWHTGDRLNYCPRKGASGAMVRTFVELARSYE